MTDPVGDPAPRRVSGAEGAAHPDPPGGPGRLAGRRIARIGYGAMQLGRVAPGTSTRCLELLRYAYDNGVNHVDTAEFYGSGLANELIRAALTPYPDDLVIVSKVGATPDATAPAGMRVAQRPAELRSDVEANLRTLGRDALTVVNLRRLNDARGLDVPDHQRVDLDDQLAELIALRSEGKIESIGLSGVTSAEILAALPAGIVCVQNSYGLLHRASDDLVRLCSEHDVAFVPFSPLGPPGAAARSVIGNDVVRAIADELGVQPAQIGLRWLLARDPAILLIPGTTDLAHLRANISAGDVTLPADVVATLDALPAD